MRIHPAAAVFPEMSAADYNALVEDIRLHGVREPIWVDRDGALLDGRHRYRATEQLGVACPQRTYEGDDPVGHVVSLNLRRRHLTEGQKAAVAADLEPLYAAQMPAGGRPKKHGAGRHHVSEDDVESARGPRAADLAAAQVGASGRAVARFKRVAEEAPALAAEIRAGNLSPWDAEKKLTAQKKAQAIAERERPADLMCLFAHLVDLNQPLNPQIEEFNNTYNATIEPITTGAPSGIVHAIHNHRAALFQDSQRLARIRDILDGDGVTFSMVVEEMHYQAERFIASTEPTPAQISAAQQRRTAAESVVALQMYAEKLLDTVEHLVISEAERNTTIELLDRVVFQLRSTQHRT